MTTILYPTRGGDSTHRNQDWAFSLAKERNARLILLYVSNVRFLDTMRTPIAIERVWEELDSMGEFLLTMAQDRAEKAGVKADKALRHGGFRRALKEIIAEEGVSAVVLGRPAQDTAITTIEYIQKVADELVAETGVEVFLLHEGQVLDQMGGQPLHSANSNQERLFMSDLLSHQLGSDKLAVNKSLSEIESQNIIGRIWQHDHDVWNPRPEEITNRLGWLHLPENMKDNLPQIQALVESVKADGFAHVLLLGMGGSSLAPEVFSKTFRPDTDTSVANGLHLEVLDSTHADAVRAYANKLDFARTLFVVSTKSGGTVETQSFFKYFYNKVSAELGSENVGDHFVAITDPGSKLEQQAQKYHFRETFLNDPDIGGRYSALSYFGLVPAALVGVDVKQLLEKAVSMTGDDGNEAGALLGAILGECAKNGRDKLTLRASSEIASFGDWVEQLIAESTGKNGKGILPVVGAPVGPPEVYGTDRLFVDLRTAGDNDDLGNLEALAEAGHPVVRIELDDLYDMGGQFFLWEMATAVAGNRLGIHPFNQPNVESAKKRARSLQEEYKEKGQLPQSRPETLTAEKLIEFLSQAKPGDYIAIHAYVQPTPDMDAALQSLRLRLRRQTKLAVTTGYGPRFLHSTGQLHKGDAGNGLFIQFTSDASEEVPIPDTAGEDASSITFNVLMMAQALGDGQALRDENRQVIHFHLSRNPLAALRQL